MLRILIASLLFCANGLTQDSGIRVYFGTQGKNSKGIYVARLDTKNGKLTEPKVAAEIQGAGFLALHPTKPLLYATTRIRGKRPNAGVAAFRIGDDGRLTVLNKRPSKGSGACHVSIDKTGRCVLVAHYGSGGVAALAIGDDGRLGAASSVHQHEGKSVHERRQQGPHAHSIYAGPDNGFAYAPDLGIDKVMIYRLLPKTGELEPIDHATVPPGSGPRHMKFGRNGKQAYILNEMLATISVFDRDAEKGSLDPVQLVSTLPEGADKERMSCSEIRVHPNGKFVYCANRDLTKQRRDSLTAFSITENGRLEHLQTIDAEVWIPRNFTLTPKGDWLLVAGQRSNEISVFAVDPKTGRLSFSGQKTPLPGPMCVVFAR